MYLAGLIVDDARMTRKDLARWVKGAYWNLLSESTVPWVAAEGPHGWAMGLEWIESKAETVAAAGWSTHGAVLKLRPDDGKLDLAKVGEPARSGQPGRVHRSSSRPARDSSDERVRDRRPVRTCLP